jgi:hypothetical protein
VVSLDSPRRALLPSLMTTPASSKLFLPINVGNILLKHRVVMGPLTRMRADSSHTHKDIAVEYYSQRASTPGTLIISEATLISEKAGGLSNVPGIWSREQIQAWRKVLWTIPIVHFELVLHTCSVSYGLLGGQPSLVFFLKLEMIMLEPQQYLWDRRLPLDRFQSKRSINTCKIIPRLPRMLSKLALME